MQGQRQSNTTETRRADASPTALIRVRPAALSSILVRLRSVTRLSVVHHALDAVTVSAAGSPSPRPTSELWDEIATWSDVEQVVPVFGQGFAAER